MNSVMPIYHFLRSAQYICRIEAIIILVCGNKMPTRCNRSFYCRSYCLLNVFGAASCEPDT